MNNKQFWGGVSLVTILILELLMDNALIGNSWPNILCMASFLKTGMFYLCLIGLVFPFTSTGNIVTSGRLTVYWKQKN